MHHGFAAAARAPITPVALDDAIAAAVEAIAASPGGADAVDAALAAFHERLEGGFVSLFLLEHGLLWLAGMRGYAMVPDGLSLQEGVVGRAARSGQPQLALDVTQDREFIPSGAGIVSELAVPIPGRDGVAGVLNVETTAPLPAEATLLVEPLRAALAGPVEQLAGQRTLDLSALARLFVYIGSMQDPRAIAELTARSLARVIPLETCQLALREDSGGLVDLATWTVSPDAPEPLPGELLATLRDRVDAAAVFGLLDGEELGPSCGAVSASRAVVLVPLRAGGEEIGILAGTSRFPREYDHHQAEAAALLGAHAAASIDAAVTLSRERHSAQTDSLTSLLNRRGFDESLERAVAAAQEARSPITIVIVDCDDFKDVNDRAGHDFGDALLRELGLVLHELVGSHGSPARLGGDEFAAVLAGVDAEGAGETAEELLQRLHAGLAAAGFPVRLSAGVATYPYDGAGTTQLKRAADQALYAAKGSGKGRATAFRDLVRAASAPRAVLADRRARDPERSPAVDLLDATSVLWAAGSTPAVLDVLARTLPYPLGAAGCVVSRVEDGHIQEVARHALRDVWLGEPVTYLLSDFPVTEDVVRSGAARAISFLDDDLDRAEAFVLRELGMSCCLLLPLQVHGAAWGIAEVYDRRHRRFTESDEATAELLVRVAARRIEALGDDGPRRRLLPVVRPRRPD